MHAHKTPTLLGKNIVRQLIPPYDVKKLLCNFKHPLTGELSWIPGSGKTGHVSNVNWSGLGTSPGQPHGWQVLLGRYVPLYVMQFSEQTISSH